MSGSFNATSNSKAGLNAPLNGPGLYIMPVQKDAKNGNVAALRIIMNTFGQIDNNIDIKNIPLNKWVNVIMRVTKQGQLDVYINGVLVKRLMLNSVPKQNYGDIFVSLNGGFAGNTSSLRYFEKAIGTNQVQSIFNKGPDTKMVVGNMPSTEKVTNKYLATRWYMKSAVDV